mgnify:FL=1
MPELPEVETVRRGLAGLILHRQITKVTGLCDKSLQIAPADISRLVTGATIAGVRRRAKMLMIDLTGGYTLLIHLKMTGQLVYRGDRVWAAGHPNDSMIGELPDKSTRTIFELSGGGKLFFNDQRKFGWIKLYPTGEVMQLASIVKLGPEPLSGDPWREFLSRLRRHQKSRIKTAILDQTVLAGVGNIYADESLWLARINPMTRVEQLSDDDLHRLLDSIVEIMNQSLWAGGSTARNYVKADGSRGDYLDKFARVYHREGRPCVRCGHEIRKIKLAGRGTHYCPDCQLLPDK